MAKTDRRIIVVAGPNGSGKTTFAESFITKIYGDSVFLNPDLIASGMAMNDFEKASFQAGRILLTEVKSRIARNESLSFESTLSGKTWAPILKAAKANGYTVEIYFLMLKNVTQNLQRIKSRVKLGGHNIPRGSVIRRHSRVFNNFWNLYRPLADNWFIFDNSNSVPKRVYSMRQYSELSQIQQKLFVKRILKGQLND